MNILDTPYLVEFFFALSTIVFLATLYAILPALIFNKRTMFKPLLINALWSRFFNKAVNGFESESFGHEKEETKKLLLVIEND